MATKGMVCAAARGMACMAMKGMAHTAVRGTMQHMHVALTCLSLPHVITIVAIGCGCSHEAARGMMRYMQVVLTYIVLTMHCHYCRHQLWGMVSP
jgi:hypothetical protein